MLLDKETQQYLSAIVAARQKTGVGIGVLRNFLSTHLEQRDTDSELTSAPTPYIERLVDTIDFFTEFCVLLFAKSHGAPYIAPSSMKALLSGRSNKEKEKLLETCLPRSMWDLHRIRRALLRFQLYCELFRQPGDSSDNDDDWEERISEQEYFWLRYEWWEVEEVKCIYELLLFSLKASVQLVGSEMEYLSADLRQERGLPQLRHFLDGTAITPFGNSYLRRFLSKGFHDFSMADPDDFSYFSLPRPTYEPHFATAMIKPPGTYRTLPPSTSNTRRWQPSPYPGVQLEELTKPTLNPVLPFERRQLQSRSPRELRTFVRLFGWVFLDWRKLYDWVEFGKSFFEFRLEAGDFDQDDRARGFRWEDRDIIDSDEVSMYRKRKVGLY